MVQPMVPVLGVPYSSVRTRVQIYHYLKNNYHGTRVPWYHGTIPWYTCTYVRTYVPWYVHVYKYNIISKTTVLEYHLGTRVRTMVLEYHTKGTMVPVHVYYK